MKLNELLKGFDVPEWRLTLNKHNLEWLQKNLHKKNSDNPEFERAMTSINKMLQNKAYKN